MTYYVYENWTIDRARVHRAECGSCNYGRGKQPNDSGRNGRWSRSFETHQEAAAFMRTLPRGDRSDCGHCRPGASQ